jgi:hypothetical protein
MNPHLLALVLHVTVAVIGMSQAVGVALVASAARRTGVPVASAVRLLRALLLVANVSVPLMFVSGGLLDYLTGGGYRGALWFRLSAALTAVVGVLIVASRRTLRHGLERPGSEGHSLRRVERLAWAMCAGVASITVLMEAKPYG